MLYSPHRKAPSLESFIAWLETKPEDETYTWSLCDRCACGQYARALGIWKIWDEFIHLYSRDRTGIWHKLNMLAFPKHDGADTFGRLLRRARAAAMETVA